MKNREWLEKLELEEYLLAFENVSSDIIWQLRDEHGESVWFEMDSDTQDYHIEAKFQMWLDKEREGVDVQSRIN